MHDAFFLTTTRKFKDFCPPQLPIKRNSDKRDSDLNLTLKMDDATTSYSNPIENINELPPEILANIFQNLDSQNDRKNAMRVCPLWDSVIDATVGLRKWIGNGSEFWESDASRWRPLMEITRCGISHCSLSDITDTLSNFKNPSSVQFRYPNLVLRLEFDGFISQPIYENLVQPLENLTSLSLHLSTLSVMSVNLQNKYFLPKLQRLAVTNEGFKRSCYKNYNMENIFNNLNSICKTKFGRLQSMEMSLPILLDKEIDMFVMLSEFVNSHCLTLEELSMRWSHRWRINRSNDDPRTNEEIDAINDRIDEVEIDSLRDPSTWKLKTLYFSIEERDTICPTALGMKAALQAQNQLSKAHFMCWHYMEMPHEFILRNKLTLTELGLTINDIDDPVNCLLFSECENLVKLILEADGQIPFENIVQAPRLMNPQGLPKSLKCLTFRNVYMENDAVDWVAKKLPKLHSLVLVNIGKIENLGMTLPTLLWLLKDNPRIKLLKVKGFNDKCVQYGYHGMPDESGGILCPTCQPEENIEIEGDGDGNRDSHSALENEDLQFLDSIMDETNLSTKYIPLIKKGKNGTWIKVNR